MTRDLIARAAAAQAAADAEAVACCAFCHAAQAPDNPLVKWQDETGTLRTLACADDDACHERFLKLNTPVPPPAPADGAETGRTAPHTPESACACGFPGRTDTLCHTHRVWLAHLNPEGT